MRQAKAAYYGLTSFMDHCAGRVLKALEDSGQAGDTLVIYTSDHGDMMGDQGYWTKQVMYEASAGVPMIAAGPGIPSGKRVTTGTTLLDLAATARQVAGLPSGDGDGRSLTGIANAADDPDRTILSEYHDGGSRTGTFMIRWQRWKYIHYCGQPPQLFDLEDDPNELRDLAQDADYAPILVEGERRLRQICDPDAVNATAFRDQKAKIEALGGEEACASAYCFNHTPTPAEQEEQQAG
jgi:choline-sulfatase